MKTAWVVTWIVILSVIISSPLFSNTAVAITGNFQPDKTPYVGVVVLFSDTARQNPIGYCSGFLISPNSHGNSRPQPTWAQKQSASASIRAQSAMPSKMEQIIYYGTSTQSTLANP